MRPRVQPWQLGALSRQPTSRGWGFKKSSSYIPLGYFISKVCHAIDDFKPWRKVLRQIWIGVEASWAMNERLLVKNSKWPLSIAPAVRASPRQTSTLFLRLEFFLWSKNTEVVVKLIFVLCNSSLIASCERSHFNTSRGSLVQLIRITKCITKMTSSEPGPIQALAS